MIVVPVYNMLLTPDATLFFQTDQLRESAGGKGVAVNEKIIFIVARKNQALSEMSAESFYPIGLAGAVTELTRQGYARDVAVTVTKAEDGSIAALTVDASSQTPGLGQRCAEEAFTGQFMDARIDAAGTRKENIGRIDDRIGFDLLNVVS